MADGDPNPNPDITKAAEAAVTKAREEWTAGEAKRIEEAVGKAREGWTAEAAKATEAATKTALEKAQSEWKAAEEARIKEASEKAATAWRDGITDKPLKEFADRFASPADLAKTAFEFRQKLSTAIVRPGKDAKPEDRAAFRKAWGVPETPDKYELAAGEGQTLDEGFKTMMSKAFHEADVNAEQAKALNQVWNGYVAEAEAKREAALKAAVETARAALQKEWPGKEFAANVTYARGAASAFGGEEFLALVESAEIDGVPLGEHPMFLKVFAKVGRAMGEDTSHLGLDPDQKTALRDQIATKRTELREAQVKQDRPLIERYSRELEELYQKRYPGVTTSG